MKTRKLLEKLFESDPYAVRNSVDHYKSMGFSDDEAKEQIRRANAKKELKTVQRDRVNGSDQDDERQEGLSAGASAILGSMKKVVKEADFHSPEERAQLDQAVAQEKQRPMSRMSRMDKLRQRTRPEAKLTHRI